MVGPQANFTPNEVWHLPRQETQTAMVLVFAGLLLSALTLLFRTDHHAQASPLDSEGDIELVRVLKQERAAGPIDAEFLTSCQNRDANKTWLRSTRCPNQVSSSL